MKKIVLTLSDAVTLLNYYLAEENEVIYEILKSRAKAVCESYGICFEDVDMICEKILDGGKIVCLREC